MPPCAHPFRRLLTFLMAPSHSECNFISYLAYCGVSPGLNLLPFTTFTLRCCLTCLSKTSYFLAHQHTISGAILCALLELVNCFNDRSRR
jgi:hypothetical protein